jgi:hypothetical protein
MLLKHFVLYMTAESGQATGKNVGGDGSNEGVHQAAGSATWFLGSGCSFYCMFFAPLCFFTPRPNEKSINQLPSHGLRPGARPSSGAPPVCCCSIYMPLHAVLQSLLCWPSPHTSCSTTASCSWTRPFSFNSVAFVTVSEKYRIILFCFSFAISVNQSGGLTKQVQNYMLDACDPQTFLLALS